MSKFYVAKSGNMYVSSYYRPLLTRRVTDIELTNDFKKAKIFTDLFYLHIFSKSNIDFYKIDEKKVSEEGEHY